MRGYSVVCWDWLKARRPWCEFQLRLGLKDSRLKPQPPHVYHYNQNSSYIWIALLSRVNAEYRHITKKSTARFSGNLRRCECGASLRREAICSRVRAARREINLPVPNHPATCRVFRNRHTRPTKRRKFGYRQWPGRFPAKRDVPTIPGQFLYPAHGQGR